MEWFVYSPWSNNILWTSENWDVDENIRAFYNFKHNQRVSVNYALSQGIFSIGSMTNMNWLECSERPDI